MIGLNVAVILSRFSSSKMMTFGGIPSIQALPQICLTFASEMIPDLLGRHYMDRTTAKDAIDDMKDGLSHP